MGPLKKYVFCIVAYFTPFNFVNFTLSLISLVLFTKLHKEAIEWQKRRFLTHMATLAYHVVSKEVQNHMIRHKWIFRHTCIYKQPTLTKEWNCNIFVQVIRDTPVGCFLDVLFLLLAVVLSELHEKPRRKDWVTEKGT